jgi:hypothetical protein
LQKGFPRNFNFLPRPKLIKDTPSQIIKQKRKTSELKSGLMTAPPLSVPHAPERKKRNKEPATLNTKNHLNSSHVKKTEDRHSLYGKKEIENESEKPENKVVFKTSKTSTCRSR